MAALRLTLSVFVLMLAVTTLTEGMRGAGPKKCCFDFIKGKLPKARVTSYVETSQQCINPGVLLNTVKGRQLCAKPSDSWVKDIITYLDTKVNIGEQTNF